MSDAKDIFYRGVYDDRVASLLITRKRAIVQVESTDDEPFWAQILKEACPNDEFYFTSETRTPSGTIATGCNNCLRFLPWLSNNKFVIAIDSDWRYLTNDEVINNQFVLHTYTHSIENHLCHASRLNSIPTRATGLSNNLFDFAAFLKAFSNEIHPLLMLYLYDLKQSEPKYTIGQLVDVITFTELDLSLDNNGEKIIKLMHDRVDSELARMKSVYPSFDLSSESQHYLPLGLDVDNSYLYVRGHNLYNLLVAVGANLCDVILTSEANRLKALGQTKAIDSLYRSAKHFKSFCCSEETLEFNYPEMQKCIAKVKALFP